MIRFGVIGTNFITDSFIEAGKKLANFKVKAVYSRTSERALTFAEKHSIDNTFTDISEMASSKEIDAVYVASPNSLHCSQAIEIMKAGKHVLCEKAMGTTSKEVEKMIKTAQENNVLLMEAMKTTYLPNFKVIEENIPRIGKVRKFYGNYCQYSSRYDKFKKGEILNAFNPKFGGGALMDIGIYLVYVDLKLFGKPEEVKCISNILSSGIDGEGSLLLKHKTSTSVLSYSKITDSDAPSEIQGDLGNIIIDDISRGGSVKLVLRDGTIENLTLDQEENLLCYEIDEFISLAMKGKKESKRNSHRLAQKVANVLEEAREQSGIIFGQELHE
ncbi:Gfo/Idh/MocA family protein [Ilyobacter polytropus]|uniref:Oxidoreductase domain protein n=1 Tax=Ilyobacter polytropus (strain ATCC 51220 / DSM 2926 / LMG 16218 / CuHBu1) TaxID=572544 RepID=E3H6Y8_ILYPC|nr:Gfo/Idh/MocA family oxidoreductase [Ilyobacter polytropus]ADO82507.1 oxidoreductase domain protein [Ilyobacter polytropus DSM 2926]